MTPKLRSKLSQTEIRDDYQRFETWTPAEAADRVGYKAQTVRLWLRQGRFAKGDAVGPFCINRDSFLAYVKTGVPQC